MSARRLFYAIAGVATGALLFLFVAPNQTHRARHPALEALPPVMLWAWERPEDLRWIPAHAGVAYVASTLELESDRVRVRTRAYPLHVRPDTVVIPVVHVDASWRDVPALNANQSNAIAEQVLRAAGTSSAHVVQLDFEVRRSQRPFLKELVQSIRHRLPGDVALSVTALASWCAGDYWIADLDADEVVPMAFRMARDDEAIRGLLAERGGFTRNRCNGAVGMATDEVMVKTTAARHYYFSPVSWNADTWRKLER